MILNGRHGASTKTGQWSEQRVEEYLRDAGFAQVVKPAEFEAERAAGRAAFISQYSNFCPSMVPNRTLKPDNVVTGPTLPYAMKMVSIECKRQEVSGTAWERIFKTILEIKQPSYPCPAIMVLDGAFLTQGDLLEGFRGHVDGVKLLAVCTRADMSETLHALGIVA